MCGIVGRVGPGRCDLAPALDSIAHRGPDDRATWRGASPGGAVDLGFVRLSIIDLSPSGRQPMANEDGAVQVVFNGEIYNFLELRRELEGRGHRFRSNSDSEVLVHGYEEYGDAVVDRLRGMFAFAIWDARQERLLCAVDRVGIKPFFWSDWGGAFHFGSEIKALLACGVPATMDAAGLEGYLQYLYVPPPRTMFREVSRLQPGHRLVWQRGTARLERYWTFPTPRPVTDERDLVAELRPILKDAVQSHLVSDAPLGAFLSGGMDSSAIVALMAQASSKPVRTFCVTFDTPAFDERVYARAVATHFGTEHTEIDVRPDVVSLLPKMVRQFDEPFGNPTALLLYSLCEKARRHV